MSSDLKAHATSKDMPPLLPGMHEGAAVEFLACLGGASLYGYNPEVDYRKWPLISSHNRKPKIISPCSKFSFERDVTSVKLQLTLSPDRKGTMVHPDFQKR